MNNKLYHYAESGLGNIYLANGYAIRETKYGPGVSINDVVGLHKAIGETLLEKPETLSGEEFRFLRKELGFAQKYLAMMFDTDEQTIANWEKGKTPVKQLGDICLRAIYRESALKENVQFTTIVDTIVNTDREHHEARDHIFAESDRWGLQLDAA